MKDVTLAIEGMSCAHCLNAVNKALGKLAGVEIESVQMGRAKLRFDESLETPEGIAAAVAAAGYPSTVVG
ncbi:MAG: cation transporter [Gemmatimonadota bacterium]